MGKFSLVQRKRNGHPILNSRGESLIYIRYSHKSREVFFSTGIASIPTYFDPRKGLINSLIDKQKSKSNEEDLKRIKRSDSVRNKKIKELRSSLEEIIDELSYHDKELTTSNLKEAYESGKKLSDSFWTKFSEYDTYRKANDKKNTYKQVPALKKSLIDFEKKKRMKLDFENLSLPLLKKYTSYLFSEKGYSTNHVGYHIKALKTFLNSCISEGIELNFNLKDLKKPVEIKSIIFLTEEELLKLYQFSFEFSRHRKAVDLFTLQAYTGFRISDLKRLNSTHISNGEIFMARSVKTDKPMQVPLIGPSTEILQKYEYNIPVISESNYNKYIKEAAAIALPDADIEITRLRNSQKIMEVEKKCKLITSHVAIKTFITMAYNRSVSVEAISKITGKSVEVIRKHYLQFSIKEASNEMKKAFE